MKASIEMRGEMVLIRVPAIGLGNAGDLIHLVRPGQDFLGVKYDRLLELGAGDVGVHTPPGLAPVPTSTPEIRDLRWQAVPRDPRCGLAPSPSTCSRSAMPTAECAFITKRSGAAFNRRSNGAG